MASTEELHVENLFAVKGYVCVVTGGGSGIGLMAAQSLAINGAKVYITGRRTDALEKAAKSHDPARGGSIIPIGPCDVTKKEDLEALVEKISKEEDHVDLLVASAGIAGTKAEPTGDTAAEVKARLWEKETFEDWEKTYNTDVSGVYFATVAFLPLLEAGSKRLGDYAASVIAISSMSGEMRHAQGHFSYNAAKGATVQLTKLMSAEFQKLSIRVNSIAPGYFPSEMTAKESGPDQKSNLPAEKVQEKGHVPAQRAGSDYDMAQTIMFLARNSYINGQIITVDGGVLNVVGS